MCTFNLAAPVGSPSEGTHTALAADTARTQESNENNPHASPAALNPKSVIRVRGRWCASAGARALAIGAAVLTLAMTPLPRAGQRPGEDALVAFIGSAAAQGTITVCQSPPIGAIARAFLQLDASEEQRLGLPAATMAQLREKTKIFVGKMSSLCAGLEQLQAHWTAFTLTAPADTSDGAVAPMLEELGGLLMMSGEALKAATDIKILLPGPIATVDQRVREKKGEVTRRQGELEAKLKANPFALGAALGEITELAKQATEWGKTLLALRSLESLDTRVTDFQNAATAAQASLSSAHRDYGKSADARSEGVARFYAKRAGSDLQKLFGWIDTFRSAIWELSSITL